MERPSHINFDTQSRLFLRRLPLLGVALCLQASVAWLLTHELINHRTGEILPGIIEVVPVPDKQPDRLPPPPDPTAVQPEKVIAIDPQFTVDHKGDTNAIHPDGGQKQVTVAVNPGIPDRAAVSIITTHTVPPYPPIARRLGAEGKVTLNLTVNAEGRVAQADIVTSSGSGELDQAAQQWIVAHWKYKPALANGVPAVSHTLATVTFNLINEH